MLSAAYPYTHPDNLTPYVAAQVAHGLPFTVSGEWFRSVFGEPPTVAAFRARIDCPGYAVTWDEAGQRFAGERE